MYDSKNITSEELLTHVLLFLAKTSLRQTPVAYRRKFTQVKAEPMSARRLVARVWSGRCFQRPLRIMHAFFTASPWQRRIDCQAVVLSVRCAQGASSSSRTAQQHSRSSVSPTIRRQQWSDVIVAATMVVRHSCSHDNVL